MEIEEFKEAWLEILQEKPYCFIGFYDQEIINQFAPIEIAPVPDTLIRVLMDFEALDEPKKNNSSDPFSTNKQKQIYRC